MVGLGLSLYAGHRGAFARHFVLQRCAGIRTEVPGAQRHGGSPPGTSLPTAASTAGGRGGDELGARNQNFLKGTFFNAFHAVREGQIAAGVSYAVVNNAVTRNEELALVYNLEPGNEQFLNDGRESDTNMSVNHGFFYVLRSVHAQPEVCHARVGHEGEWESAASFVSGF